MTNALEAILRRPKTVMTMMLLMLSIGIATYISIPKEANPDIDIPVFYVSVTQQGISPQDAERLLVRPMETELRGLDGLKELTTIGSEGHAAALLEFDIDFDKDKALADLRDKVDQAQASFPADADEATITETNLSLEPTIYVTLSGDVPERTLYKHARRLKDEIEAIGTVREANLSGHREEVMEVVVNLEKLESYNISQSDLINAVSLNNQLVPAGFIEGESGRFNIKVPGLVEDATDVFSIPVSQNGEAVITLGDVAELRRTFKDADTYTRVNGSPAIAIEVIKRIGQNIIANNQEVNDVVNEYTKDWPDAIKINFLLDESNFIYEVLGSLEASILTAIFLVMVVLLATLGLRSALLVGLSIPLSFMVAFMILGGIGMTVNMMVMFGLVLTVGLLVDGAIVVTEYADRKMAEGMPHSEAYIRAAKMMLWPIVSSTATTLAAFMPMLLWPGVPGEFMSYLPIMVIIVLSASLVTAMIFLPVCGALLGALFATIGRHAALITGLISAIAIGFGVYGFFGASFGSTVALAMGLVVGLAVGLGVVYPLFKWLKTRAKPLEEDETAKLLSGDAPLDLKRLKGLTGFYARTVNLLANNLIGNAVVIAIIVAVCFLTVVTLPGKFAGVEFFVDEEPDQTVILVSARGNFSAGEARDFVGEVEEVILDIPGIRSVVMTASAPSAGGGGGPASGGIQDKPADVIGELSLELENYCCRPTWAVIEKEIREKTSGFAGLKVEPRKIEGGPPQGKDVYVEVKSTSYETMVEAVAKVRGYFNQQDDLVDIEDGRPLPGIEWKLTIDREEAARYDATIAAVGSMVQLVTNGVQIGSYRPDDSDDELDIRVRLPEGQRGIDEFESLRLRTSKGLVPLSNFVTREAQPKVSSITRRDGLYAMDVKANMKPGAQFEGRDMTANDKVQQVQAWLDEQAWDDSVQFKFRGGDEEQQESMAFLGNAAIASLFIMFIILVTQFNSFYQSALTLSTIVLAVFGVLIGMMITDQKFSVIMTGTGVIALAGIVVNNAIVLIDTYNRMREDGIDIREAVVKTAAQRARPILLTTITTIAGLIPMATQINLNFFERTISAGGITSIWWVQLSTAIISGLAFSTFLTLFMIPTMLALPNNVMRLFRSDKKVDAPVQQPVTAEVAVTQVTKAPKPSNDDEKSAPIAAE